MLGNSERHGLPDDYRHRSLQDTAKQ